MPDSLNDVDHQTKLRLEAEARLKTRTSPPTKGWTLGLETLDLLFKLSSDPDRASDALKLLHELQTFQVELDMQHEQLEANEREIAHDRDYYKALYDFAPTGYFLVSLGGQILKSNLAGARLLGVARVEFCNHPVTNFLAPESRPKMLTLLQHIQSGSPVASCVVLSENRGRGSQMLHIAANISPNREAILMVVSEYDGMVQD